VRVAVDTSSPVPAYEQIRAQVTALSDSGALPAGTRLPPIRQLAADLGLAPGTVAKAYALLERGGVASSHRRRGTVITDRGTLDRDQQLAELQRAATTYARTARLLGVDDGTAVAAVGRAMEDDRAAGRPADVP
jgi:DNA-binding transcriptional regulator YhcF (GntR family)